MKEMPDDPKRRALVYLALVLLLPILILARLDEARRADRPTLAQMEQEVATAVQQDLREAWEKVPPEQVQADFAAFERLPVSEQFQVELTARMIRAIGSGKELSGDEPLSPVDLHHALKARRERLRIERVQARHQRRQRSAEVSPVATVTTAPVTTRR